MGGGIIGISSDGSDQMEAKKKDTKNSLGLPTKPPKTPWTKN